MTRDDDPNGPATCAHCFQVVPQLDGGYAGPDGLVLHAECARELLARSAAVRAALLAPPPPPDDDDDDDDVDEPTPLLLEPDLGGEG